MAVTTSQLAPDNRTIVPERAMRRLSHAFFSFLQSVAPSHATERLNNPSPESL